MAEQIHRRCSHIYPGVSIEARRNISLTKRLDKTLPKLDQRLVSMSQAVPPQPTGRTETGIRRIYDTRNSNAGHLQKNCFWFSAQVDGRAVGCLLISETARWLDRPTTHITNKLAGGPTNDDPYFQSTDQQTSKPIIRPASYKSNHWPSVHLSDRPPTNQLEIVLTSDQCMNF